MTHTIRRYRVRGRPNLCITPGEAVVTGVTAGEEEVEELVLVDPPGFMHPGLAAIRVESDEALQQMTAMERGEMLFERKGEPAEYIQAHGGPAKFRVCGVKSRQLFSRSALNAL